MEKVLTEFSKQLKGKFGVTSMCKSCVRNKSKDWYKNNREYRLTTCKIYQQENKELIAKRAKDFRIKNKERLNKESAERYSKNKEAKAEYAKIYYEQNKLDYFVRSSKRRCIKLNATPKWAEDELSLLAIQELYRKAMLLSSLTNTKYHVDHIVPLQSELVCGLHCLDNLQILPADENIRKSNRYWPDMP